MLINLGLFGIRDYCQWLFVSVIKSVSLTLLNTHSVVLRYESFLYIQLFSSVYYIQSIIDLICLNSFKNDKVVNFLSSTTYLGYYKFSFTFLNTFISIMFMNETFFFVDLKIVVSMFQVRVLVHNTEICLSWDSLRYVYMTRIIQF